MSPKRFSQYIANLCPVPARAVLAVLGFFVALAALASLLLLLGPVSAPVTAAPAVTDLSLDLGGPLQFMTPVTPTTTTLTRSPDRATVYGESVTFTATVTHGTGVPVDTGTVFFNDGGVTIGTAALNASGVATLTTFRLAAGDHEMTAVYHGDGTYEESESATLTHTVAKADTEIDPFVSSDHDSVYGQYVVFTATVTISETVATPGATTPTGLVTFWSDDGTYELPMGQGPLNGEGQAWFGTSALAVGDYTITASYEGDANYNPSDEDLDQDVDKADTSVTVSGPNSSYYGKSVTFEAKVSVVPPGAGSPTGKVEFTGWGDSVEATLFEGKATFMPIEPHDVGSVTISAEYKGDDNFKSDTGTKNHTVNKAHTTTELRDLLSETDYGQDAQFLISVKRHEDEPGSGIPTGLVILLSAGPLAITETLPANSSVVTIITNTLPPGDHAAWASYSGDTNFLPSASTVVTHTVNKADSETTLVSSANPSAFGQSVTFTATVEAAGLGLFAPISPTGTVTFTFGTAGTMTDTLDASGVASVMTDTLPAGTHEITAEYSGDSSFEPSEDSLSQAVNTIATTTKLDGPVSSAIGDSVTFTATVSETLSGDPVTDGDVTFYDGVTVLATVALNVSGQATYNTSSLSAGLHPLKAVYNGTANFQASTSQRLYHTVGAVGSTTTLTSSPASPTVFGQTVTFTATVTGSGGTPTGQVTFKDGAATIGTRTLVGGVATLTKSDLSVGPHTITAVYGGDSNYAGSNGSTSHTVNKANTTTTINSVNPVSPTVVGQPVTVNFTVVASGAGGGTPTGNVTVSDGTVSCVGAVAAGTCTLIPTSAGAKTLTATYAGDANFNGSSDDEGHDVDPADTTTTVTTSPNPSVTDQEVTITANVTVDPPGAGAPTGTVTFTVEATTVAVPLSGGSASTTYTFTTVGPFLITADYGGDSNFNNSSGATTHNVNVTPPDLSVTKTDSPDPVNVGNDLTYVINVTNNETDPVNVTLVDTLPPKVSFVSASGGCTHDGSALGGVVTCDLGSLAGHGSASVTIVVNVPLTTPAGTVLRNTAQAGVHSDTEETTVYRSPHLGDCNGDDAVTLADVWSIVRHIFDPTYVGTTGCDANQDQRVDAGDVPSTVLIMFREANHERQASNVKRQSSEGPALAMPDQVSAAPGGLATVPVTFDANGHSITSLIFSVDYDETWLALDPTDHDGNGVPDAVIFSLPGDFTASVTFDEGDADGEVDVFIGDISPPLTSLSDGPMVFLLLDADSSPGKTQGAVRFSLDPAASFGDTSGQSVPGTATPTGRYQHQIYLPIVTH